MDIIVTRMSQLIQTSLVVRLQSGRKSLDTKGWNKRVGTCGQSSSAK